MGHITKILAERETGGGIYDDTARLEIEESIHFHFRDLRLILNKRDFLTLCSTFREAEKKYQQIGQPETTEKMVSLADAPLTPGLSHNRVGLEHQIDQTVHVHYKDLRMHLSTADFLYIASLFAHSAVNLPPSYTKIVSLSNCSYHEVVNKHVATLRAYKEGSYPKVSAEEEQHLREQIIAARSNVGDFSQRTLGFPDEYPGPVSEYLDNRYLFALYESIRKYGYAGAGYSGQYIVAYQLDQETYLTGAHRTAVLLSLEYTDILVYLVKPETGWRTSV